MHRPVLGKVGSTVFEIFVEVLELTSITLGFYAILQTSSKPLIEDEENQIEEAQLFIDLAVNTRVFVVLAISVFLVVFLLRTVVRRFIILTPSE